MFLKEKLNGGLNFEEKEENKGKMRFLLGESMGGAIVLLLARMKPDFWDGAVLVAPMCKVCDSYLIFCFSFSVFLWQLLFFSLSLSQLVVN